MVHQNKNQETEGMERWKTEEQFVNNRLIWLGFTQSLLFTAYGVTLTNKNPSPRNRPKQGGWLPPYLGLKPKQNKQVRTKPQNDLSN